MNPLLRPAGAVLAALLSAGLFQVAPSGAQPVFRGVIRDAVTGEGLELATIQVKGTFRGTIANQEGQFSLKLEQVPAILLMTHIGYKSQEIAVTVVSSNPLDVRLAPAPYVLQETTVTPENPAQRIMRQVIQRKQEWCPRIRRWQGQHQWSVLKCRQPIRILQA